MALGEFINNRDVEWINHFLKEETLAKQTANIKNCWWANNYKEVLSEANILTPVLMEMAIKYYCLSIIYQMNNELGLPAIEEELHLFALVWCLAGTLCEVAVDDK